jgi:hypothetical protein
MTGWVLLGAACACAALVLPDTARQRKVARLDPDRMLIVEGQARFIIGLYEHPNDAKLREAAEAGFNLIQCPPDEMALDRVRSAGAWAWINTGMALDLSEDTEKRKSQLADTVRRFAAHPALLVWEGPDEGLWNCWYGAMQELEAEFAAMRSEAAGRSSLRALLESALDCYDRALWREFEAARAEFWRATGKPCPKPAVRMDTAAQRASKMGEGFTAGARYLRSLDPGRFIWLNHAPRNSVRAMREHNRAVDMAGCDIYPIPFNRAVGHSDLVNMRPSSVGDYTDRMRDAAPGKACAMVLQGFGWRDLQEKTDEAEAKLGFGRRPSLREQRFMAWDAIVHGANAILYWGTAYVKEPDSEDAKRFWGDLLTAVREVRDLEPFLVAPEVRPSPTVRVEENYASQDGGGVRLMLRKAADGYLLVVVNENPNGVAFTVNGLPPALEGRTLERFGHDGARIVKGRSLRDGIRGFDVHLYRVAQ